MQFLFYASAAGMMLAFVAPFLVRLIAPRWARRS